MERRGRDQAGRLVAFAQQCRAGGAPLPGASSLPPWPSCGPQPPSASEASIIEHERRARGRGAGRGAYLLVEAGVLDGLHDLLRLLALLVLHTERLVLHNLLHLLSSGALQRLLRHGSGNARTRHSLRKAMEQGDTSTRARHSQQSTPIAYTAVGRGENGRII